VTGLDEAAAKSVTSTLDAMHEAIRLTALPIVGEWLQTLRALVDRPDLPGLLAGRLLRILRDEGALDADAVELRLARSLTIGVPAATAAGVIEGFVGDGGLVLVHDESLLNLIDGWLIGLPPESFDDVLPCCAAPSRPSPVRSGAPLGSSCAAHHMRRDRPMWTISTLGAPSSCCPPSEP
jgi:hypothetical protein